MTAHLVRQAQGGDQPAFEQLIRPAYDRLYATAYRLTRDRFAAEDAVQDAIVRCWRDIRGLKDPERFEAWLHRLLVNSCADHGRRVARRPIEIQSPPMESPALVDEYAAVGEHDALERAFTQIPMAQRVALVLTHYLGYSAPEVAEIVGIPVGTVYSRVHKGNLAMREALLPPTARRIAATELPQ